MTRVFASWGALLNERRDDSLQKSSKRERLAYPDDLEGRSMELLRCLVRGGGEAVAEEGKHDALTIGQVVLGHTSRYRKFGP